MARHSQSPPRCSSAEAKASCRPIEPCGVSEPEIALRQVEQSLRPSFHHGRRLGLGPGTRRFFAAVVKELTEQRIVHGTVPGVGSVDQPEGHATPSALREHGDEIRIPRANVGQFDHQSVGFGSPTRATLVAQGPDVGFVRVRERQNRDSPVEGRLSAPVTRCKFFVSLSVKICNVRISIRGKCF